MNITVRFAPSPTGQIHIGNTRTALFNWLFARQNNGRFVLRFDDTDQERSRAEYVDQIEQDLAWLGIKPDLVLQKKQYRHHKKPNKQKRSTKTTHRIKKTPKQTPKTKHQE